MRENQVEILHDVVISDNLGRDGTCAFPSTAVMKDGTLVCLYRRGQTKHSYDGVWISQRSTDQGRTWSAPSVIFDRRSHQPQQSVISGGVCQTPNGSLLTVFTVVEVDKSGKYVFDGGGAQLQCLCFIARSNDVGRSWSQAALLLIPCRMRQGISSKPLVLKNGEIFLHGEHVLPNGVTAIFVGFSKDDGHQFGTFTDFITDHEGKLNYCDARFAILPEGKILAMLWTFRQDNEQTIDVHSSISPDFGRTWSVPRPVGKLGQITVPLAIDAGRFIAVSNYREPLDGIRLWFSVDGGNSWLVEQPIQMWDPHQNRVVGKPIAAISDQNGSQTVWEALPGFTFGTPDIVQMPDNTLLLSYYATISQVIHIRACRFRIKDGLN